MSKLFRIVLALGFIMSTVLSTWAETIDIPRTIRIMVNIPATTSLEIQTRNVALDDALVDPSALGFSGISGRGMPPAGNPWVVSDQYLRIQYSSTYGSWAVRIVTDNEDLEADLNDVIDTIAGADINPDPAITTWAYSGLLSLSEIAKPLLDQDPSNRAPWAWQVFAAKQPAVTAPTSLIGASGALEDGATIGDWNDDWIYIADKNDAGYTGAILVDADRDGAVDDLNYGIAVIGSGPGGGTLAQHPAADPKPGDGDVVVYIASRFANTNYGGPSPRPYLLGAGDYSASLYVELIRE